MTIVELGPSETPSKQGEVMFALGAADLTFALTPSSFHFVLV
jgi:hypothetical protein